MHFPQLPSHTHQIQIKEWTRNETKIGEVQSNEKWQLKYLNA
jgi:hypothetical protein